MNYCELFSRTIQQMCNTDIGAVLPPEYQQVEYLESSGTQYISTGVAVTTNYERLEIKINCSRLKSGDRYFGYWRGGAGLCSILLYQSGSGPLDNLAIGSYMGSSGVSTAINTDYEIDLTADNGTLTGTIGSSSVNISYGGTAAAGAGYTENVFKDQLWCGAAKIYYYRLYTSDGLQRDLIPCYRKSDSVPGMYDLVSKTFFTNAGTGEFTVGPDI